MTRIKIKDLPELKKIIDGDCIIPIVNDPKYNEGDITGVAKVTIFELVVAIEKEVAKNGKLKMSFERYKGNDYLKFCLRS